MVKVSNHIALVTGASDGIGLELAKQCAAHGHAVILVADNQQKLEAAAQQIRREHPTAIEIIVADLAKLDGARQVYAAVQHMGLKVDVLINNAGAGVYGEFATTDLAEELAMIQLNIGAVVQLTKLFVNDMLRQNGGRILITSSVAGLSGSPFLVVYGATKAFGFNFAMGLREELKDKGITVTALLPSGTDTNFFRRAHMEDSTIVQKGKLADPQEVAKAGFEAMMAGEAYVASPFKAKVFDLLSQILPEDTKARISKKQQEPANAATRERRKAS